MWGSAAKIAIKAAVLCTVTQISGPLNHWALPLSKHAKNQVAGLNESNGIEQEQLCFIFFSSRA